MGTECGEKYLERDDWRQLLMNRSGEWNYSSEASSFSSFFSAAGAGAGAAFFTLIRGGRFLYLTT